MKEKMDEGYDIVIASRFAKEKKSLSPRMFGSRVIAMAIFLTTGRRIKDPTSGMRMYNCIKIKLWARARYSLLLSEAGSPCGGGAMSYAGANGWHQLSHAVECRKIYASYVDFYSIYSKFQK